MRSFTIYSTLLESIFFFFNIFLLHCRWFRVFVVDIFGVPFIHFIRIDLKRMHTYTDTYTVSPYGHVTNCKRFFNQIFTIFVFFHSVLFLRAFLCVCALTVNRNRGISFLACQQCRACSVCMHSVVLGNCIRSGRFLMQRSAGATWVPHMQNASIVEKKENSNKVIKIDKNLYDIRGCITLLQWFSPHA